ILAGFAFCLQELQNFVCLIARGFSLALRPSRERLGRHSYRLGYFGNVLNDDVSVVSKSSELFFGGFHELTIPRTANIKSNTLRVRPPRSKSIPGGLKTTLST